MRFVRVLGLAAFAAGLLSARLGVRGVRRKGQSTIYMKYGCWQCHGMVGQGGVTGPKLAPDPMPFDASVGVRPRQSNRGMPPYMEAVLPNEDLADIHAYLAVDPEGPEGPQGHPAAESVAAARLDVAHCERAKQSRSGWIASSLCSSHDGARPGSQIQHQPLALAAGAADHHLGVRRLLLLAEDGVPVHRARRRSRAARTRRRCRARTNSRRRRRHRAAPAGCSALPG